MSQLGFHVLLLVLLHHVSQEMIFQLQKGTYSKYSLCKNSNPFHVTSARSIGECFTICQILLRNDCKSFKYEKERNLCSLYKDVIRHDFDEYKNGSCVGYQILSNCQNGFRYLIEGNKCLQMMIGTWNWTMAMTVCNKLHPRSHLVVVDNKLDAALNFLYLKSEVFPSSYWTAGISLYRNAVRQPFRWNPFPNVTQELKATAPWITGEPNSPTDGTPFCIIMVDLRGLDDIRCINQFISVLCEIDMA